MKGQGACWATEESPTVQGWVGEEQTAKESEEDWPERQKKSQESVVSPKPGEKSISKRKTWAAVLNAETMSLMITEKESLKGQKQQKSLNP